MTVRKFRTILPQHYYTAYKTISQIADCSGQGKLTWSSGAVYEGQWENDRRNGQGTLTYANGYVESGTWKNDEFMG